MTTPSPTLPPVTARFTYRPVTADNGSYSGLDSVWLQPRDRSTAGPAGVATMIDCWYPAHYMRAVSNHLRGVDPLVEEPPATNLLGAHIMFPSPETAYGSVGFALLATKVTSATEGHYHDHVELWSERGDLLATAAVLRRNVHPTR